MLAEISTQNKKNIFYHYEQQASSEVNKRKNTEEESSFIGKINKINRQPGITYEELNNLILSVNTQQRKMFTAVQDWSRKEIKAISFKKFP